MKSTKNLGKVLMVDIGDIHFSNNNPEKLYKELKENFIDFIEDNANVIDLILISGDYFHYEIKLSSKAFMYASNALTQILDIAKNNNIEVRMLRGTASHDCNQVEALGYILRSYENFKVISTVTSEEVFTGFKILYIPEEYPKDLREYYKDTIFGVADDTYDAVSFHGTFDFQSFQSQVLESERFVESAPVWDTNEFIRICKGPVIGGHIHVASSYKDKVFYHGSFSRMSFGEPNEKGFNVVEYNIGDSSYEVAFVDNPDAPLFLDVDFDSLFEGYSGNIEMTLKHVQDDIERYDESASPSFRIKMSAKLMQDNPDVRKIVTDWISNKPNISLTKSSRVKSTASESATIEVDDTVQEEVNEYAFLTDNRLDVSEKIQQFIKLNLEQDMELDDIREAIIKD